ncbi:ABC transporter ATP-binding protein [Actinomyces vulturis]|uniref:ABC transporter ATP-binding protein n=1 Tax=Actinomyces vulturis TaxID=1857645 RepID=UPI00082EB61E|nr:ABC transporter ATP-binding protein [Actinomyces vulturis]
MTTSNSPVLTLDNVSKDFRQGDEIIHALRPTDLDIYAGEFVGILGPSGSGKSTMLTIMGGLRSPGNGRVFINGEKFSELKEKQRAEIRHRKIGFVLQAAGLVPFLQINDQFSLYDRVAGTKPNFDRRDDLMKSLDISKYGKSYPGDLSGGERQRAAIAVALYHDPALILADEPTAALDTQRAMTVAKILADQTHERDKATVMVTHDERLLDVCDRVLQMKDGELTTIR